jgi:hypothetical protein
MSYASQAYLISLLLLCTVCAGMNKLQMPKFDINHEHVDLFPCSGGECTPNFIDKIIRIDETRNIAMIPMQKANMLTQFDLNDFTVREWFQGPIDDSFDTCVVSSASPFTYCIHQQTAEGFYFSLWQFETASVFRGPSTYNVIITTRESPYLNPFIIESDGLLFVCMHNSCFFCSQRQCYSTWTPQLIFIGLKSPLQEQGFTHRPVLSK